MSLVKRLAAGKQLKTLRNANLASPEDLAEAKSKLVAHGRGVITAVVDLLDHSEARAPALDVLLELLSTSNYRNFIAGMNSESPQVVAGIVECLARGQLYDPHLLIETLKTEDHLRTGIEHALVAQRERVDSDRLAEELAKADKEVRAILIRLVPERPDAVIEDAVLQLLHSGDWWIKTRVLRMCSTYKRSKVVPRVMEMCRDESSHVRQEALNVLGELKIKDAAPLICELLSDEDIKVHTAAIDALIAIGDTGSMMHLIEVLKDPSEYARRGAVEVLNAVATTDAVQDLVEALSDEDWWVRVRAADALGALGGTKVADAAMNLIEHEDPFIRRYAVEILNTVQDPRAIHHLIKALNDHDWWVRERSIDGLGNLAAAQATVPLCELMESDVKAAPLCAKALVKIADERCVSSLIDYLGSHKPAVREAAHKTLEELLELPAISEPNRERMRDALRRVAEVKDQLQTESDSAPAQPPVPAAPAAPRKREMPQEMVAGAKIAERYEIIRRIGQGGFGQVYLVTDHEVGEDIVLKILDERISLDQSAIKRFQQEVRYARRISHPNVIRLYDFLRIDDTYALSMEYFESVDLGRVLQARGPLDSKRCLALAKQICAGLEEAHKQSIIHRDIKPQNLLVSNRGAIKIVDFGLAAIVQGDDTRITKTGIVMGTLLYMAPEQIQGKEVDLRADIYALGVVLYELLTGEVPFKGTTPAQVMYQHLEGTMVPVGMKAKNVPASFERLVTSMLATDVAKRPQTVSEVLAAIEQISS